MIFAWAKQNRWWLWLGLGLTLLILLLVAAGVLLYGYWEDHSALAPVTPTREIANTDVNPYGANFFLNREVEPWKIDTTLRMASEAGIGWVKLHVPWEEIEPTRKDVYLDPATQTDTWLKYDRILTACEAHNLQVVARLDRSPDWTRADNSYKERPPDDLADYGDFCYAFVEHFRGRVHYIQVWNEPNIFPEWGNRAVDPAGYVELLRVAYTRIKEADPNVRVLSAPLAITLGQEHPEPGKWIAMSDLDYLEAMYKAGAGDYFDILAANAFGMDRPPEDPPAADVLNFARVSLQREIMERYGDGHKAVWINEFGWNAAPETMAADALIWQRVSEQQQAEYSVRAIQTAREDWPWCGVFMIWYFRQVGNISPDRADYYFRMVDPDFTPRPLYWAVQDATTAMQLPGPGSYQETHLTVERQGDWLTVIDEQALGEGYLASDQVGDTLTFRFKGAGVDLHTRRTGDGGRLYVSIDDAPLSDLERDADGQSYVDLAGTPAGTSLRLPLARELHTDEHILLLTVAPGDDGRAGTCVVDGFTVMGVQDTRFPWLWVGLVLLGLGLDGWFLAHTWRRLRWVIRRP